MKNNTRKVVRILGDLEVINTRMTPNIVIKEDVLRTTKLFIDSNSKIEQSVIRYIERILGCKFDASCVEAEPHHASSLIYHCVKPNRKYILFMYIQSENKKVNFPEYYSADKYA